MKGRFRSFLLASLNHFLANEWDKARALKRGGGQPLISLDAAETRYRAEPGESMSADRIFERQWALTLLAQVTARLREDYTRREGAVVRCPANLPLGRKARPLIGKRLTNWA